MEKKKLIIFTDIGDTIVDEGTEVRKVPFGVVYGADCIEGAKETMLELYRRGFTIVLVADGLSESFHNTMEQNGLDHIFADWIISEEVGAEKPRPIMFETAMRRLGLTDADLDQETSAIVGLEMLKSQALLGNEPSLLLMARLLDLLDGN